MIDFKKLILKFSEIPGIKKNQFLYLKALASLVLPDGKKISFDADKILELVFYEIDFFLEILKSAITKIKLINNLSDKDRANDASEKLFIMNQFLMSIIHKDNYNLLNESTKFTKIDVLNKMDAIDEMIFMFSSLFS